MDISVATGSSSLVPSGCGESGFGFSSPFSTNELSDFGRWNLWCPGRCVLFCGALMKSLRSMCVLLWASVEYFSLQILGSSLQMKSLISMCFLLWASVEYFSPKNLQILGSFLQMKSLISMCFLLWAFVEYFSQKNLQLLGSFLQAYPGVFPQFSSLEESSQQVSVCFLLQASQKKKSVVLWGPSSPEEF
nr:hypothetical protein Iba_chr02bCG12580 [Ipomoea batatas]